MIGPGVVVQKFSYLHRSSLKKTLNQNHTRIINIQCLSDPKFAPVVAAETANFGFGTLSAGTNHLGLVVRDTAP